MPSRPPRRRTTDVGAAPKVRRNPNAEPPDHRRCQVCGQVCPDTVRQLSPPEPARYTCRTCLEDAGQLRLDPCDASTPDPSSG